MSSEDARTITAGNILQNRLPADLDDERIAERIVALAGEIAAAEERQAAKDRAGKTPKQPYTTKPRDVFD